MGRHTATEDRSVDPRGSGEVGWPAEPHDGRGLGWPGDLSADGDDEPGGTAGDARAIGSPAA